MNEFKQWIHGIAELLAGPSQKYQDLEKNKIDGKFYAPVNDI